MMKTLKKKKERKKERKKRKENQNCIKYGQEKIKGTEKASPIHTLFHR